jgi:hypothetical protein
VAPGEGRLAWIGRAALILLAGSILVAAVIGAIDARRGYRISNVRLATATEAESGVPIWRVRFDAEWSAFGDPPVQVQPCTVRLIAADGTVIAERGFGLHVGRGDRDVSPPFDFPVSALTGDPDRAQVVCSRQG